MKLQKIKIHFLTSLLIFISMTAFADIPEVDDNAENGKITGTIQDAGDNDYIPYASVVLFNKADSSQVSGVITDENGFFKLDKVPDGEYYLLIDYIGYNKRIIKDISVKKGNKNLELGILKMSKSQNSIEEVEIVEEKDIIQYKIDKKVINVSKKIVASGGTVVDALENTPSVQVDVEGNVSVRGSSNFTVLIDGKPTALSGNDALKSIPAAAVENIELITNPSAKYDPDGTSGIINIIMKKEYKTGVNGIINASVGTALKHSTDFTLNYRTDKVNYFVSASYNKRPQYPTTLIDNETFYNDTLRFVTQDADRTQTMKSYNMKAGADFYLNETNTLSFSGDYGYWGFNLDMDAEITEHTEPISFTDFKRTQSVMEIGGNYVNGNISFDHDFAKDHDLVTSFTYSTWDGENLSDVNEQTTDDTYTNISGANHHRTDRNDVNQDFRFKSDYTRPLSEKSKLEMGIQTRYLVLDSDFSKFDQTFGTTDWVEQTEFSNEMEFTRLIQSAYTTFSSEFKGIQYKLGIRGEYTDRVLTQLTTGKEFIYNKFDYFPTVHLSKQLKKGQQLQASYSKRVNRPQPWNLNPFPMYSDSYISQAGNPSLIPEYTDSYELNYMKRIKIGFAAFEAYYRQTNNGFERTMNVDDDGIVVIGTENLSRNFAYGGEFSGNFKFNKWLSVYASANLYSYNIEGEIVSENVEVQSIKSDFTLNSTISLSKTTRLQLTGFYRAPTITSQGFRSEMYGMNAAISQDFFKRRLSVVLRGRDILQTMKFSFEAESSETKTSFVYNMEAPVIMLNISYKINNYKKRKADPDAETNFGGGGVL